MKMSQTQLKAAFDSIEPSEKTLKEILNRAVAQSEQVQTVKKVPVVKPVLIGAAALALVIGGVFTFNGFNPVEPPVAPIEATAPHASQMTDYQADEADMANEVIRPDSIEFDEYVIGVWCFSEDTMLIMTSDDGEFIIHQYVDFQPSGKSIPADNPMSDEEIQEYIDSFDESGISPYTYRELHGERHFNSPAAVYRYDDGILLYYSRSNRFEVFDKNLNLITEHSFPDDTGKSRYSISAISKDGGRIIYEVVEDWVSNHGGKAMSVNSFSNNLQMNDERRFLTDSGLWGDYTGEEIFGFTSIHGVVSFIGNEVCIISGFINGFATDDDGYDIISVRALLTLDGEILDMQIIDDSQNNVFFLPFDIPQSEKYAVFYEYREEDMLLEFRHYIQNALGELITTREVAVGVAVAFCDDGDFAVVANEKVIEFIDLV
jgi:hypothetical protein